MPLKNPIPPRPTVVVRKKRPATAVATSAPVSAPTQAKKETGKPPPAQTPPPQPKATTLPAAKPPPSVQPPVTPPPVAQPSAREPHQPNRQQREAQIRWELLRVFRERWPQMFPVDMRQTKPFALGIHQDIIQALPDVKPWRIRQAIALFQRGGRGAYWRAIVKGGPRYDLDGQPNGEVTAAEQEKARQDLEALAARRKAKGQGHSQTETSVSAAGENTTTSQEKPASAAEF